MWLAGGVSQAGEGGKSIPVEVGRTITRTWDDLKVADYVYGPRQTYDAATQETRIWLPYGSGAPYFEASGVRFIDLEPEQVAAVVSEGDGTRCLNWGYRLRFDKPIRSFRWAVHVLEVRLKNAVAGAAYSVDGRTWTTLKETDKSGQYPGFLKASDTRVDGLKTRDLYLRFYTRAKGDPSAERCDGASFKLWTAGDPVWGDAATTFFNVQPQIWVKAAE